MLALSERVKMCSRCHIVKPWSEYNVRKRWPNGTPRNVYAYCRPCNVAYTREWRRANPEQAAATDKRARERYMSKPEKRALKSATDRARLQRIKQDPEQLAVLRLQKREGRRRARDTPPERWRVDVPEHVNGFGSVDAAPFRAWLLSIRPEFESVTSKGRNDSISHMAGHLGISQNVLGGLLSGTKATVAFSTVDRALCGYGRPDLLDVLVPMEKVA